MAAEKLTVAPSADTWGGHARLDARGLALGRLIATRLQERPERLALARAVLVRWQGLCSPRVQPVLSEWQIILDAGLDATVAVLVGEDERSVRLRQSAPFADERIVSRQERLALWRRFAG